MSKSGSDRIIKVDGDKITTYTSTLSAKGNFEFNISTRFDIPPEKDIKHHDNTQMPDTIC